MTQIVLLKIIDFLNCEKIPDSNILHKYPDDFYQLEKNEKNWFFKLTFGLRKYWNCIYEKNSRDSNFFYTHPEDLLDLKKMKILIFQTDSSDLKNIEKSDFLKLEKFQRF